MVRPDPGQRTLELWNRLHALPGGRWLFSRILGWRIPYTGALGATVLELRPGRATVELRERRGVRNHLGSVHAVAVANLGELATGLATVTALPPGVRGIVVALEIEYRKKARGRLLAECRTDPPTAPEAGEDTEHEAVTAIRDAQGDVVAVARARWRLRGDRRTAAG